MVIKDFITHLAALNLFLVADGQRLRLQADRKKISDEAVTAVKNDENIIRYIRDNKAALLQYLRQNPSLGASSSSNIMAIYKLSPLQNGILFHCLYNRNPGTYVEQFVCAIEDLDEGIFSAVWQNIIKRHSILRSVFYHDAFKVPVQCVHHHADLPLRIINLLNLPASERQRELARLKQEDRNAPFDFKSPPLMRMLLVRVEENKHVMIWSSHHILFDGWSTFVLLREFLSNYKLMVDGQPLGVTEDRFEDYIRFLDGIKKQDAEQYWRAYLENVSAPTLLPFVRPNVERNKVIKPHNTVAIKLTSSGDEIRAFAREHRLTVNTVMQGVWAYLLSRYTGKRDIVFGITVSGRPDEFPSVEDRVGLYINTVPFFAMTDETASMEGWLLQLQNEQVRSRAYQFNSVIDIQNWLGVGSELFDTMLAFQNYPASRVDGADTRPLRFAFLEMNEQALNYPLALRISVEESVNIEFLYKPDLLAEQQVRRIAGHFDHVVRQVVRKEAKRCDDLVLLTDEEMNGFVDGWQGVGVYPQYETILDVWNACVSEFSGREALCFEEQRLTYAELDERANKLADFLSKSGVGLETVVPICLEPGLEMVISIFAVMKAGGAYVPVDPQYPAQRIGFILDDIGSNLVVSTSGNPANAKLQELASLIIHADTVIDADEASTIEFSVDVKPSNLAYVIYTSGSTGQPKGVMIEHRNVLNLVYNQVGPLKLRPGISVFQFASFSFDASCHEIFCTLLHGGKLVLARREIIHDPKALGRLLNRHQVELITLPPSYQMTFTARVPSLRTIISAGEKFNVSAARAIREINDVNVINAYGPTENTVSSILSTDPVSPDGTISIGYPVANVQAFIVDNLDRLVPIGVKGEILLAGKQLARGYWKRPDLSREKFGVMELSGGVEIPVYRTGDIGRWLEDGKIEYVGRADDQVKINGIRVELSEIEYTLEEHPSIRKAVVIKTGDERLTGYVQADGLSEDEIGAFVAGKLPHYMVPHTISIVDAFPTTINGKIDKDALRELQTNNNVSYVAPRTEVEKALVNIWQELLSVEHVGIADNFFKLGGDSIKVIGLVSRIQKSLNCPVNLQEVYQAETLEALAIVVGKSHPDSSMKCDRDRVSAELLQLKDEIISRFPDPHLIEDIYPMSDIQLGMVYAASIDPNNAVYHDQMVYAPIRNFDLEIFKKALLLVVAKHSIFRTAFYFDKEKGGLQVVYKFIPAEIKCIDATAQESSSIPVIIEDYLAEKRKNPFILDRAPQWRVAVFDTCLGYILIFECHHALLDGWSVASMNTELNNLYLLIRDSGNVVQSKLKSSYRDLVIDSILAKRDAEEHHVFWRNALNGYKRLDIFSLEADHTKGIKVFESRYLRQIDSLASERNLSLKGVFLSAYLFTLGLLTYEDELTVGLVTNTRPLREDGDKLLGCFLNTVPFRMKKTSIDQSWRSYFEAVENQIKGLTPHMRIPLADICAATGERRGEVNPYFDALLNFVNFHIYDKIQEGLIELESMDLSLSKDDGFETSRPSNVGFEATNTFLDWTVSITHNRLTIGYTLRKKLKSGKTVEDLLQYFSNTLDAFLQKYDSPIDSASIFSDYQRSELNNTPAFSPTFPFDKTIVDVIVEQVERSPENIAASFRGESISYKELDARSNQLARYLQKMGICRGQLIPICLDRGLDMIVGILGILKAGGVYVPIDPDHPRDRVHYVLGDIEASLVIANRNFSAIVEGPGRVVVDFDFDAQRISQQEAGRLPRIAQSNDVAYIIYTSGSTGKPKGVMVEHRNVVRLFLTDQPLFDFSADDVWTLFHSICFDFSVWELYGALFFGGRIVIVPKEATRDMEEFALLLRDEQVTILNQTPSAFYSLQHHVCSKTYDLRVRYVIFGGEALNPARLKPWHLAYRACKLVNMYGITETTVHVTYQPIGEREILNGASLIGRPIPTLQVYILDKRQNILPQGVIGEIYVEGAGVSRGYLNRPELTQARFIKDVFKKGSISNYYRTGDLARCLSDGSLEYFGRIDDQIKIRGFRIELGEIENVLLQTKWFEEVVVLARPDHHGEPRLNAYLVPLGSFDRTATVNYLKSQLPDYMIPMVFHDMREMPLTINGKVDKQKLLAIDHESPMTVLYVAPKTEVEKEVSVIWKEILCLDRIGVDQNFFDLGGHSLLATRVTMALSTKYHVKLPIRVLFEHPTVGSFSKYIELKLLENNIEASASAGYETVDI